MNCITIDFTTRTIIITETNQTLSLSCLKKEDFAGFIPKRFREKDSFTWNFDSETISVNQSCIRGKIKKCYIPEAIIPLRGLKKRQTELLTLIQNHNTYIGC